MVETFNGWKRSSFKKIIYTDITPNIIQALELMSEKRKKEIALAIPRIFRKVVESFAGVSGSKVYNSFNERYFSYISGCFYIEK